jgi:Bacterial regulatory helix-turn-helix protein, lysR family
MPIRLEHLKTMSREGAVSAAARALGYTQPAVSHPSPGVMSAAERRPPVVLAMLGALREASAALAATPEAAALGIRAA